MKNGKLADLKGIGLTFIVTALTIAITGLILSVALPAFYLGALGIMTGGLILIVIENFFAARPN